MAASAKENYKKSIKKAKDRDDRILSDSDGSHVDLECDTCGVVLTDMKSYENHLQGKKHQRRVSEVKLIAKHLTAGVKEEDSGEDDEDPREIHCEVCDKDISGYHAYMAHLKGRDHAKYVKKQKLKEQLKGMPGVLDKSDIESESEEDDYLVKPYAKCATCEKSFSGPEPFDKHLKSAAHKKKVKSSKSLQDLKNKHGDANPIPDDDEPFSKCNVCQKSFSGHIPYQIHMASRAHNKSLEKKKVAEEIKQFCLNEEASDGYVCKECKKAFTDPLAFKSHLENNSHEKRKAKDALLEFLTSHPEIVFVTPLDKANSDESDAEESSSQYYLICKLCHMSFSGPESAQDHVKSKKHTHAKTEKKMLKLLKKQTSPSVEPKDKNGGVKDLSANGNTVNSRVKAPAKSEKHDDFELL